MVGEARARAQAQERDQKSSQRDATFMQGVQFVFSCGLLARAARRSRCEATLRGRNIATATLGSR